MTRRGFAVTAGASLPGLAWCAEAGTEAAADGAADSVRSRQLAISPADVSHVEGFLGRRLAANQSYLAAFNVEQFLELVENKKYQEWFWIGEQPGKWLEAAIYANASGANEALDAKARAALARLVAAQDEDGYLGITDPAIRTQRHPMRGMDAYELYYTLHALLTAAGQWRSAPARRAAMRLGDFFLAKVKPGVAEFWPLPRPITIAGHEVHYGMEGTLLLDPMMRLYQATGESRYLDWCRWVFGSIDRWTVMGTYTNLGKVAGGVMKLNQVQTKVHAHTLHMNMLGFLRLYQVGGDPELLRVVLAAWRAIMAEQRYITGGVSVGESYREPHRLFNTGQTVETCASMSWLLLNQSLLELTGDPAHADAMESVIWNHLPAAQTWESDGYRYFCPLNGWKPAGYFTGPNCCSSSGPRIFAMLPAFFYGAGGDSIFVNQYVPSQASFRIAGKPVRLKVSGDYPSGPSVAVEIVDLELPMNFALRLRLPGWCSNPSVKVNGAPQPVVPGSTPAIRREWKRGDRVELTLPMETRWVEGAYSNRGLIALTRGPLVYALDTVWTLPEGLTAGVSSMPQVLDYRKDGSTPTEADPFAAVSRNLRPAETPAGALGPAYSTEVTLAGGKRLSALLLPFANLGKWYGSEAEKRALTPPPATLKALAASESAGYQQGRELTRKTHPFAVWLKPAG
ncbi:MAG: beta-L-arabinofuranosidase domain-containing protein [Bryobacteraceae bacterium]